MKIFDWHVSEWSRINRLPGFLHPPALALRNIFAGEEIEYGHHFDGMITRHNDGFMNSAGFRKAYDRAVVASGWDYRIPWRVHQALWCSRVAQRVQGDFVELGTGRGFIMSAVLEDFPRWEVAGKSLHLFDTFKSSKVRPNGAQVDSDDPSPHYAKSESDVRKNFSEWSRVNIYGGDIFVTLPTITAEEVSLLHIDLNYFAPEVYGLRFLWDRISKGGVVLLDDYASKGFEEQYKAMNGLAEELDFCILSTPTGQGIIIK